MLSIDYELQGCELTMDEIVRFLNLPKQQKSEIPELESSQVVIKYPAVEATTSGGYRCLRCSNTDSARFFQHEVYSRLIYCLECLTLGRMSLSTQFYYWPSLPSDPNPTIRCAWQGHYSPAQHQAAHQLMDQLSDVTRADLVHAVTGSGKTEIIYPLIEHQLQQGKRTALASPRIDVVLELAPRLAQAFPQVEIQLMYGGSEETYRYAPLVISTTHQLLRFKHAFDLIIVDEVDAFPYVNSEMLHYAVQKANRPQGKCVFLTATPDAKLQQQIANHEVNSILIPARYHRHRLPEPQFVWLGDWRRAIQRRDRWSHLANHLQSFLHLSGVKLIFLPSIPMAEALFDWLRELDTSVRLACVHAQDVDRKEKVLQLREGELDGLITTTILERGVTFPQCHVFVVGAEHPQFNMSSLVQISGRVGRRPDYPTGTLIFGHFGRSKSMVQAREEIQQMNQLAIEKGMLANE